jgi:hypothetical protein
LSLGMKVLPKQTVRAPSQVIMMDETKTCHGLETKSACLTAYIWTVMLPVNNVLAGVIDSRGLLHTSNSTD